jgi:hypothetical protein
MKNLLIILFILFISSLSFSQSIVIGSGAEINVGTGADICVQNGTITGNLTGTGTQCGGPLILPIPTAPVCVSPANNSTGISLTPSMLWNAVTYAASYRLQISTDSLFATFQFDTAGFTATTITVPSGKLSNNIKYYWRVNASNTSGTGPWSVVWNFTTLPPLPGTPTLTLPANGASTVRTITFKWNAVSNANTRRLQIANDNGFATIIKDTTVVPDSARFIFIPGGTHYWRVAGINAAGQGPWSAVWNFTVYPLGVNTYSSEMPKEYALYNNYPNPFNPMTKIRFDIPKNEFVKLTIYDILGKEIMCLSDEKLNAGSYEASFNASNLPSGIYICRLISGEYVASKKMLLIK